MVWSLTSPSLPYVKFSDHVGICLRHSLDIAAVSAGISVDYVHYDLLTYLSA